MILDECEKWLRQAKTPALYSGLVHSHNPRMSEEMLASGYEKSLQEVIAELKTVFEEELTLNLEKKWFQVEKHTKHVRKVP